MNEDEEMEDRRETIEMIVDSACRSTIVKPKASNSIKVKEMEHVGRNFRAVKRGML